MSFDCQRELIAWDAAAVIDDPKEITTTFQCFHLDGSRASVDRVLQQLFNRATWSLDHFAGGNAVDDGIRKSLNRPRQKRHPLRRIELQLSVTILIGLSRRNAHASAANHAAWRKDKILAFNEWQHIEWMRKQIAAAATVPVGIGDDCAVVEIAGQAALITVDMLVEGVHFDLSTCSAIDVGRKAMNVNLSDIAAMAGTPICAVVAVALPSGRSEDLPKQLFEGLKNAADAFNVAIVGGDTNRSTGGLVISVTVFGEPHAKGSLLRSRAVPEDKILVTGPLGYSLDGKHLTFTPRLREARRLHDEYSLHAMMDLSDGLASDLFHLTGQSGCGAIVEASRVPIRKPASGLASDERTALDHALNDGEDFELLFTAPADQAERMIALQPLRDLGVEMTIIGAITAANDVLLRQNGKLTPLRRGGYTHTF